MKRLILQLAAGCSLVFAFNSSASVRYVDVNNTNPESPYTSWATAATNIQHAISVSGSGDTVLVTNGIYQTGGFSSGSGSNRVYLFNNVTVRSVNGPGFTTIKGYQVPGTTNGNSAVRCVYLTNAATLSGFTLTNGATPLSSGFGGGVYCASTNCVLTNCLIVGNSAGSGGGGAYSGILVNCSLIGNSAAFSGGGADNGTLNNCLLTGNSASYGGAVAANSYTASTILNNCTIYGNSASVEGGGLASLGVAAPTHIFATNCIVFGNSAPNGFNYVFEVAEELTFNHCCTVPIPTNGTGNVTGDPQFVNPAGDNFHLHPWSPCIHAGNNSFITNSTDLDGNPRIVAGTVDLGAYEFQWPVRYVSLSNSTPVSPFTNWVSAATNIQDAIDVANAGDYIVVSNGVYKTGGRVMYGLLTNRIAINKPIIVQSVNGPAVTRVEGFRLPGGSDLGDAAVRCVYVTNGASLIGFTLTNGATRNFSGGDLDREQCGGALWAETNGLATVSNCLFIANSAAYYGGGTYGGTIINSSFITNRAYMGGGANAGNLINCVFYNNRASAGGGASYSSTLVNCTLVRNATSDLLGGGSLGGTLTNCILYLNTATGRTNNYSASLLNYCCTTPLPTNGVGNFTNAPLFVDQTGGNLRLQSNSPCINAGNNSCVTLANDLDGNPRIVGGTVDLGAYECQSPALLDYYTWLLGYGLPTDAALAYTNSDGDGVNNWQEYLADTSPIDANDYLHITSFTRDGTYNFLQWSSKSTRLYQVQRRETLDGASAWETIITNAEPGWYNVGFDSTGPQYFYRIQAVQP